MYGSPQSSQKVLLFLQNEGRFFHFIIPKSEIFQRELLQTIISFHTTEMILMRKQICSVISPLFIFYEENTKDIVWYLKYFIHITR